MKPLFSLYREEVKKKFFQQLDTKTSWGKEQIKQLYIETEADVLAEILSME